MKPLRSTTLCVLAALIALSLLAARSAPVPTASAFDQLKTLIGIGEGVSSDGKSVRLTYEAASGGTALVERRKPAEESEMVTVYSPDGDRLAVTHDCSAGNQSPCAPNPSPASRKNSPFPSSVPSISPVPMPPQAPVGSHRRGPRPFHTGMDLFRKREVQHGNLPLHAEKLAARRSETQNSSAPRPAPPHSVLIAAVAAPRFR